MFSLEKISGASRYLRSLEPRRRRFFAIFFGLFLFFLWFIPWVPMLYTDSITVTQYTKKLGENRAKVGPGEADWIAIGNVSRQVLNAIVVAEDARFYHHFGLDLREIWHSYQLNLKKGRFARGGSTITQQVVKMGFLSREKTLTRKSREALGAVALEFIMSKDRILEWYINLTEFGDNIYGIRAAAAHYYNTRPDLLTIEQAVNLALVIPSPNAWSSGLRKRNLTPFGEKRYATILTNMRRQGFITETQWVNALSRGNFGHAISGYEKLVATEAKTTGPETPLLEDSFDTDSDFSEGELWGEGNAASSKPKPAPSSAAPSSPDLLEPSSAEPVDIETPSPEPLAQPSESSPLVQPSEPTEQIP